MPRPMSAIDRICAVAAELERFGSDRSLGQARNLRQCAAMLEADARYIERLALCPDHRDKTTGRCVVCQAEERTRAEIRHLREGLQTIVDGYDESRDDLVAEARCALAPPTGRGDTR